MQGPHEASSCSGGVHADNGEALAATVAAVGDALLSLSLTPSADGDDGTQRPPRPLATPEDRDALIELARKATTSAAVQQLSCDIADIVGSNADVVAMFGTAEMRDALIAMAEHATTSAAVASLAQAINCMACETSDANGAYNRLHEANMALFGTAEMRDALLVLAAHATTNDAVDAVAKAIGEIMCPKKAEALKLIFGTAEVRDALVAMSSRAETDAAMSSIVNAICYITRHSTANKVTYATKEVRELLCAAAFRATPSEALVHRIGTALRNITMHFKNIRSFVTTEVRDALVALSRHATTDGQCVVRIAWIISNVSWTKGGNFAVTFCCNTVIRDLLVSLANAVGSLHSDKKDAAKFLLEAISNVTYISPFSHNFALFSSAEVCAALIGLSRYVKDSKTATCFGQIVTHITQQQHNSVKVRVGSCAMRDALLAVALHASSTESAGWVLSALRELTVSADTAPLFATADVSKVIVDLVAAHATEDTDQTWQNAACFLDVVENIARHQREVLQPESPFATPALLNAVAANEPRAPSRQAQIHRLFSALRRVQPRPRSTSPESRPQR